MKVFSRTDPRDENRIFDMEIVSVSVEDLPPDYYNLIALVFAFMAITMKIRVYSWLVCLLSFASLANQRYSSMDAKTVAANLSLIVLTFLSTHAKVANQPVMSPLFPWLKGKQ